MSYKQQQEQPQAAPAALNADPPAMPGLFNINMPSQQLGAISALGLAHVGDAVYDLLVRSWLCVNGGLTARQLHMQAVDYVRAPAQARAAESVLPLLTQQEQAVFRRGRNAKVNSVPQNADIAQYHCATGLEALFGWLYLSGQIERINKLFSAIAGVN